MGNWLLEAPDETVSRQWARVRNGLQGFKTLIERADAEAIKQGGQVPVGLAEEILASFDELCELINREVGDTSPLDVDAREELGRRLKGELLPYLLLTETAERFYSKPRGYAGDFKTIDLVYRNQAAGYGRMGAVLDQCFLNVAAAHAVRNRRGLLVEEITQAVNRLGGGQTLVTSLACGPAAEIFDCFAAMDNPGRLRATLIDIDEQALTFVSAEAKKRNCDQYLETYRANLVHLTTGRVQLDIPPQDLIYSIGLADYFDDSFAIRLIDYAYDLLRPGGTLIIGNFHPRNGSKALMDYLFEWRLIHRTEADMNRLFASSKFGRGCTRVRFEEENVNLFAECTKAPEQ